MCRGHGSGVSGHYYHPDCIALWLKEKLECPGCREPVDITPSWKERAITILQFGATGLVLTTAAAAAARGIATESGSMAAVEVLQSRWIQSAALCAALCVQSEIGSGRLYQLRKILAAASFYVGIEAGAAIGVTAHAAAPVQSIAPALGGITAIATTLLSASSASHSPWAVTMGAGALTTAGLGLASLANGACLQGTSLGAISGAVTGAAAVALSSIAIPVAMATGRYLWHRVAGP